MQAWQFERSLWSKMVKRTPRGLHVPFLYVPIIRTWLKHRGPDYEWHHRMESTFWQGLGSLIVSRAITRPFWRRNPSYAHFYATLALCAMVRYGAYSTGSPVRGG